ncbi:MAG: CHAT domain-containing protein, partial [Planctomycetaceae bacterium]
AGSYAALGRSAEAVRAQKQAYDITRKIVPNGVAERYLYARGLGVVLSDTANKSEAARYLNEALTGLVRLEGEKSEVVADIRSRLSTLNVRSPDMNVADKGSDRSGPANESSSNGTGTTDFMLYILRSTPLKAGSKVLTRVSAGTKLWSLERKGDWHRVRLPDKPGFGWVHNATVEPLQDRLGLQRVMQALAQIESETDRLRAVQNAQVAMTAIHTAQEAGNAGDYRTLIAELEKALPAFDSALGGNNFASATARTQLANGYLLDEKFLKARRALEDNLPLQREVMGENHFAVANTLFQLSTLLQGLGDLDTAHRHTEEALRICLASFGPKDRRTVDTRLQLGNTLSTLGQYQEALKQLDIVANQSEFPEFGQTAQIAIAQLEQNRDKPQRAKSLLDRVVPKITETANQQQTAYLNAVRANVEMDLANPDKARELAIEADQLMREAGSTNRLFIAKNQALISMASFMTGKVEEALSSAKQALEGTGQVVGPDHHSAAQVRHVLAGALAANGRTAEAATEFDRARRAIHNYCVRALVDLTPQQQIAFLQSSDESFLAASLTLAMRDPAHAEASATWLLNGKNLAHEIASRSSRASRLIKSDRDRQTFTAWSDVRRRLAILPSSTEEKSQTRLREQERQRLSNEEARLFSSLPKAVQTDILEQQAEWVTCEEIRNRIPKDETLVEIIRMVPGKFDTARSIARARKALAKGRSATEHYIAWIIPPAGDGQVKLVDLGLADRIDEAVLVARDATVAPFKTSEEEPVSLIDRVGEAEATKQTLDAYKPLTKSVWNPIVKELGGRPNVCLSPDGNLWLIPWTALPLDNEKLLIEEHAVRLSVSGRYLKKDGQLKPTGTQPVIIANPDYEATTTDILQAARQLVGPVVDRLARFLPAVPAIEFKEPFDELPGTASEAVEVREFVKRYSNKVPRILVQAQASEVMFKNLSQPDALFIGTHGFFREDTTEDNEAIEGSRSVSISASQAIDTNPLLRCGLVLAGGNRGAESGFNDGILTGEEIVSTDLRGCRLVVLSACETGIGRVQNGQGVSGLRQSFELAGADSVMSTLWSINDTETARLMPLFFKNLADGTNKAEALRQAQLERIKARQNREGAAHPFYWAAFTLSGQR